MYPPSKKNNYHYPTMLSVPFPLLSILRNFEFVYLKSGFAHLIFSRCFIISRFFLGNHDYKTFHHKTLEPILRKKPPFMWNQVSCFYSITIIQVFFSIVTYFIIAYHISQVNVQTNYCNSNLLIFDVKQLNKTMKLYYFYTLKALWDGQGIIKMYYGMSRV